MKSARINWGMLGGGTGSLIGRVHRNAAALADCYRLAGGAFSSNPAVSADFARDHDIAVTRAYADVDHLVAGENALPPAQRMRLVTIATPNHLHFQGARTLVNAGFNVLCEKPLSTTVAQAEELQQLVRARGVVFAVAHTYTGYPMVRQMRAMIAAGAIGPVQRVHVQYYQGWINPVLRDPQRRRQVWRLDPKVAGASSCMGDIGVHCFNLIEYTTGLHVERVLADTDTGVSDNSLDVDGSVLVRLAGNVPGVLCASQIATAEENNLQLAVYGRSGALKWSQEVPQRLEFLQENAPLSVYTPGQPFNEPIARAATKLPSGHPEGFTEAMANIYRGMAHAINGEPVDAAMFPDIHAGVRGMRFIAAVLESVEAGNTWRQIQDKP